LFGITVLLSPLAAAFRASAAPQGLKGWAAAALERARLVRRDAGEKLIGGLAKAAALAAELHPLAHPPGVTVTRGVRYREGGETRHQLDVYRPRAAAGPLPIVMYVHGGGLTNLSKETHRLMGRTFAARGALVFNVDYRLAPRHRFPAAHEDVFAAYRWIVEHAAALGGDLSRITLAGESAGAGLVTSLALATSYDRPEPFAHQVFALDVRPRLVLPASPHVQISAPEQTLGEATREPGGGQRPWFLVRDRVRGVFEKYLAPAAAGGVDTALADPLRLLELSAPPERPLPSFFVVASRADPLLAQSKRLAAALERLGVRSELGVYGGGHAFHAQIWRSEAQRAWRDMFDHLDRWN
jgi:acetyl esterase